MQNQRSIFFTGFPGFIGTRIVKKLVEIDEDIRIKTLVLKNVQKRSAKIIKNWHLEDKIELLAGDISKPNLGLKEEDYLRITNETTDVFHLAAIYDMEVPKEVAWKVNVKGTLNMLNFAKKCPNLSVFVFFSSTVAAGKIKGDVFEDKLDTNCEFHFNYYEQTKFASEILVRRYMEKGLPVIIIRPGAVIGDSQTGVTDKYDGFYMAFRYISILKMFPIWMPNSSFRVPMVPVDYVVDATCFVATEKNCIGHCFQLGEFDLTANQFLAYICDKDESGTKLSIPTKLFEMMIQLPFFRYIFLNKLVKYFMKKGFNMPAEMLEAMDSYNFCRYRTDNKKFLEAAGIRIPRFKDYVKNVVEFYEKNQPTPETG